MRSAVIVRSLHNIHLPLRIFQWSFCPDLLNKVQRGAFDFKKKFHFYSIMALTNRIEICSLSLLVFLVVVPANPNTWYLLFTQWRSFE